MNNYIVQVEKVRISVPGGRFFEISMHDYMLSEGGLDDYSRDSRQDDWLRRIGNGQQGRLSQLEIFLHHPACTFTDVLEKGANSDTIRVRCKVAYNPNTPLDTLAKLIVDENEDVRRTAEKALIRRMQNGNG